MIPTLQAYLLEYHELPLPGIGLMTAQQRPAMMDPDKKKFIPPDTLLDFVPYDTDEPMPVQHLAGFIAMHHQLPEESAFEYLETFLQNARLEMEERGTWPWPPLGTFVREDSGAIHFEQQPLPPVFSALEVSLDAVVSAGKPDAGAAAEPALQEEEPEVVEQTTEYPAYPEAPAPDRWWVWPLVLALGAAALIAARLWLGLI